MSHCARAFFATTTNALRWWMVRVLCVAVALIQPAVLQAQAHAHEPELSTRDARLDLMLGGPHLILYHRGYLALGEAQISGLQKLQRAVCEAELLYVEQTATWRERLAPLLGDTSQLPPRGSRAAARPTQLDEVTIGVATAESAWLTALLHARRDALALLTASQRTQVAALRDHWAREAGVMIEEATRPGQRGHPGTQVPIRVPGMVVHTTSLLPHCEQLHGPSRHIVIPPPR